MRRSFHGAWALVALYAITGSIGLVSLALDGFGLSSSGPTQLVGLGVLGSASFAALALTLHYAGGRSLREGVVAACAIGLTLLLFSFVRGGEERLGFSDVELSVQEALAVVVGAVAAGSVFRRAPKLMLTAVKGPRWDAFARATLSAMVIMGACVVHGVIVGVVALSDPAIAGLVGLAFLWVTPAIVAALLQWRYQGEAELHIFHGLAILLGAAGVFLLQYGALTGIGGAILGMIPAVAFYLLALPGAVFTRHSRSWSRRCHEVPEAILVQKGA